MDLHLCDGLAQIIVVMSFVGQDNLALKAVEQSLGGEAVVPLTGGEL
ncbi:hypothetical protein [Caulobacter sp. LARHSG274]